MGISVEASTPTALEHRDLKASAKRFSSLFHRIASFKTKSMSTGSKPESITGKKSATKLTPTAIIEEQLPSSRPLTNCFGTSYLEANTLADRNNAFLRSGLVSSNDSNDSESCSAPLSEGTSPSSAMLESVYHTNFDDRYRCLNDTPSAWRPSFRSLSSSLEYDSDVACDSSISDMSRSTGDSASHRSSSSVPRVVRFQEDLLVESPDEQLWRLEQHSLLEQISELRACKDKLEDEMERQRGEAERRRIEVEELKTLLMHSGYFSDSTDDAASPRVRHQTHSLPSNHKRNSVLSSRNFDPANVDPANGPNGSGGKSYASDANMTPRPIRRSFMSTSASENAAISAAADRTLQRNQSQPLVSSRPTSPVTCRFKPVALRNVVRTSVLILTPTAQSNHK